LSLRDGPAGNVEQCDVLVIGAGPAGSVAAAMLRRKGRRVVVLERQTFPRFSIGESLLPQSMEYLEEAGLLRAVVEAGYQHKNGAAFARGSQYTEFDFRDKFSAGWGTTFQVPRADFDHVLAREAGRAGADVRFRHEVVAADVSRDRPRVRVRAPDGSDYAVEAAMLLDASGFGRILPKLLDLERPSDFHVRGAIFTHIQDGIAAGAHDRNKIRIIIHPRHVDVWYWLIPFSNGRASFGVVARQEFLAGYPGSETQRLQALLAEDPGTSDLLRSAVWDTPARQIVGYSANVKSLCGRGYALLGNAGEFLDPIFSSGVTIAFKSASLACACLEREARGETVDWQEDYARALKKGVDTFRAFVDSWYAGDFQRIIFWKDAEPDVRRKLCAILAGYAWDESNPYVRESKRRLATLEEYCSA
jgi:flavin-dependent dehydrogenase